MTESPPPLMHLNARLGRVAALAVAAAVIAFVIPFCVRQAGGAAARGPAPTETRQSAAPPLVEAVLRVAMTVSDLDASVAFYSRVLDFTPVAESEEAGESIERLTGVFGARVRSARLRLGSETIELSQFLAPEGRPIPADSRSNDRWFQHIAIVVSDMERAYTHLRQHKVRHASSGPQKLPAWNTDAAGIEAFYFKDPDGHILEVIHFPSGKGDPRWQPTDGRLFLGIDHTAIVVADTEASLRFYRDTLGLRIAGGSENFGTEQEHLNNVFGARLRITTLRAATGPGVELLEYLAPSGGRAYPPDSAANDLWHWHTVLGGPDVGSVASALQLAGARLVSSGLQPPNPPSAVGGVRFQDPDGHVVMIAGPRDAVPRAHAPEATK